MERSEMAFDLVGIVTPSSVIKSLLTEVVEAAGNTSPRVAALTACMRPIPTFTFARVGARLFRLAGVEVEDGAALLGNLHMVGPRCAATRLPLGPSCLS